MDLAPHPADDEQLIATGRRVIATEAGALGTLERTLGCEFARALGVILGARGRVIVSGMGKSGHVGRKIAATFASTGTPAMFVHPAEASHGDLGMITPADVVLLLSNSGETPELADLLAYSKRFQIPVIGVCGRASSTLMRQASVGILLPSEPEACPVGLAPTTSTTMTLALGDAMAVALMEHRAFTPEDFRDFHPGGRLGARLATVGQLMHVGEELPLIGLDAPMSEVLIEISHKSFGVAGVTDADGGLVGIITDGDLRRHMVGLLERVAEEVMTRDPLTVSTAALASEALGIMNARKITTLFAVSADDLTGAPRPAGILHIHDCLRAGIT